jgi:NADPH:quinone reductase-like Zn-dependent oxidoreductase
MKAIVVENSGNPRAVKLSDVPKPKPKSNEILIKIKASTVTSGDVMLRKFPKFLLAIIGLIAGFKDHKITGTELAGEVEEVGRNVSRFSVGDRVAGTSTGLVFGGNAEYVSVPEEWKTVVITKLPESVDFIEGAALIVGGLTALYLLNKANSIKNRKVLIYGASGSVGSYALQIAMAKGAHVTAVCSKKNFDMVKSLGADTVIDYNTEDFTNADDKYEVILDAVGKITKKQCRKILTKDGFYLTVKSMTEESIENLNTLLAMYADGKLKVFIDKTYPLEKTADAHKYVETGRKRGNVVITHL